MAQLLSQLGVFLTWAHVAAGVGVEGGEPALRPAVYQLVHAQQRRQQVRLELGFGRIVASEIEALNMLVNMV